MDPAGTRPAGFAPPASRGPASRPGRPSTPSALAGPTAIDPSDRTFDRPSERLPNGLGTSGTGRSEASFGPVSQVVTVSIRTPSSRIDLTLPDRMTLAEVLETVLEVAPRSLREQALAHGGWILRTAAGRPLPGATTLLDEGVTTGATLYLAGADTAESAVVYDDVADAVADAVRATAGERAGAGRAVALGGSAAFAMLAILAVVALGPPWTTPALVLALFAVAAQIAAALLARRGGDVAIAVIAVLASVVAGAAATVLAAAGSGPLTAQGPTGWLLGVVTAAVLAGTGSLAVGSFRVPFGAVITGAALLAPALAGDLVFDLGRLGTAALAVGLAVCVMPILPGLSLRLAAFDSDPLPTGPREVAAARHPVDLPDVRGRTSLAVALLTAALHGCAWTALAAGIALAFGDRPAGQALTAVVGLALLLRARLFRSTGQRLPLLLTGLGCLLAVPAGLLVPPTSAVTLAAVAGVAGAAAVLAAVIAGRRMRRTPALARAADIGDLVLTIAVIPLVAAVLGAFAFVRGLGG